MTRLDKTEQYAIRENLEVVFSRFHRYHDRIFYDKREGKYYDKDTDLYLFDAELKQFGLNA